MKELFEDAVLEVFAFDAEDVITTSNGCQFDCSDDEGCDDN